MRERQWAQVTVNKQYREHAFCKHCPRLRTAVESKSIERYTELYGEAPFEKVVGGVPFSGWRYLRSTKEERTPNADLSRDCMGQRCRGWMDLETHIWHPPRIFLQGRTSITKKREPGIQIIDCTP